MFRRIPLVARMLLGRKLDAPDLLTRQHIQVEMLLALCRLSRAERRRRVFERLKTNLGAHAEIEEQIFYPASAAYEELKPLLTNNYEEHQRMRDIMNEMTLIPADDKQFERCLGALFAIINAHVNDEENALFPRVRGVMSCQQRLLLAGEMQTYFRSLVREPAG